MADTNIWWEEAVALERKCEGKVLEMGNAYVYDDGESRKVICWDTHKGCPINHLEIAVKRSSRR